LFLALPGAWWVIKDQRREARLLLVWVMAAAIMIYVPFGLQRRFLMGIYVPLAALAGYGLEALEARFSLLAARRIAVLTMVLTLPTLMLSLLLGLFGVQTHDPAFYQTRAEAQALAWLEGNTPARALVLAAPDTGLLIPAYTGRRVLYGHPYETPDADRQKAQVMEFFQGGFAAPADFLDQHGVSYIFYGPRERKLGALPSQVEVQPVYFTGFPGEHGVVIYRVAGAE
jgi:4-amino-4-deoxy-L-arabinose transferase-like glycosyltransferase